MFFVIPLTVQNLFKVSLNPLRDRSMLLCFVIDEIFLLNKSHIARSDDMNNKALPCEGGSHFEQYAGKIYAFGVEK